MTPFLQAAGFSADKTTFVPVAAMAGINLARGDDEQLRTWYKGPTLVEVLGTPFSLRVSSIRTELSSVFR
jgi:elongation factor 1 alpha-like protein